MQRNKIQLWKCTNCNQGKFSPCYSFEPIRNATTKLLCVHKADRDADWHKSFDYDLIKKKQPIRR